MILKNNIIISVNYFETLADCSNIPETNIKNTIYS